MRYIANKSKKDKKRSKIEREIIYGKNACLGCLNGHNRTIYSVYILATKWNDYYNNIPEKYKSLCKKCNAQEMFSITHENDKHQGLALSVSKYNFSSIEEMLEQNTDNERIALFLLDRVQDPHNVGNIIRTAYCLNIDGIILTDRDACGITQAVVRTSSGYSEVSRIYQVGNIANAIDKLKKHGYWIIGFDVNTNTADNLPSIVKKYNKCVFVFGSEGNGVKDLVKKSCDVLLRLPMKQGAESLNVANTTTIVAWEWMNAVSK